MSLTEHLLEEALNDERSGRDPIPMITGALRASRTEQGEMPADDDIDDLREYVEADEHDPICRA